MNSRNPLEKTGASSAETCNSGKICDATGKIPYATTAKAWRVIKRMKDRSRSRKVYRCSECNHWHIGAGQKKPAGLSLSKPAGLSLSKSDAGRPQQEPEARR